MSFEAMTEAILNMKTMVEELYHRAQGGAETSVKS